MAHIVLLGDSIFDNARYTLGEPDVISQGRQLLPASWRATLLAVDGRVARFPGIINTLGAPFLAYFARSGPQGCRQRKRFAVTRPAVGSSS